MVRWYLSIKEYIRAIEQKAKDALEIYESQGKEAADTINRYMKLDYERLWDLWKKKFPDEHLGNLGRHIHFGMDNDYRDIINYDLPDIEKKAESHLLDYSTQQNDDQIGFEKLLHPIIQENAYQLYRNGHLRESVLNSITAVFDFIRKKQVKTKMVIV